MNELSEAGAAVVARIRRRRGLLVRPAVAMSPPMTVQVDYSFVRRKAEQWAVVEREMKEFLTGSGLLPEPMRGTATRIEGNFYPNAREIREEFRRALS